MSGTTTGIGITHLGEVAVNAKDVDRAAAFYQNKLGLKLLFKAQGWHFSLGAGCGSGRRSRSSIIPVRFCISPYPIFRQLTEN
jgi:catechol 2,3-dioxygenase-like lactoylglutathione lyase family enzyme